MAASTEEMAASLTMEDVPIKLRCAACQASLPEACPVCLHEPIKKEDCRPNKALRTTVKVFLKKKIIDRENMRKAKELSDKAVAAPPATPLQEQTSIPRPSETPAPTATEAAGNGVEAKQSSREQSQIFQVSKDGEEKAADAVVPTESQKDVPQMSIESPGLELPRQDSAQTAGDGSIGQDKTDENGKSSEQQQISGQTQQWANTNGMGQGMNTAGFGLDGANGFPNMGVNGMGEFSQMMQFMPNGMPNPIMGAFPNMMGMPGMMDPSMMSQGMYGGFGGQGMGMNGMNMGMGFDAGQGAFGGGFNGQPSWNAGQNKFNQNAYGGQAGSDFGANAGSYGAGYNMPPQHQGNFNQMTHHQNYSNNDFYHGHHGQGFQARGRGRGRGYQNYGRGRGGYNQFNQYNQAAQGNYANNDGFHQQTPSEVTRRGSPQYGEKLEQPLQQHQDPTNEGSQQTGVAADILTAEEQMNKELNPGDADDDMPDPALQPLIREDAVVLTEPVVPEIKEPEQAETADKPAEENQEKPAPIESFVPDEDAQAVVPVLDNNAVTTPTMLPPPGPSIPTGPAARYSGDVPLDTSPRGRGAGRGYFRGNDFRAGSMGRGSGYISNTSAPRAQQFTSPVKPIVLPVEPKGLGVEGAPKGPKALREGAPNNGVKGFSIAGRASATPQARPNGVTSTESPSTEDEREKRRERHRRHSRKYEDENGDGKGSKESRTRDASADSSFKRSSHRSRRDHEKEKDSERSSHRSHRHRDRSREPEDTHRSSKKRSPSPEISIHGASRINGIVKPVIANSRKDREDEFTQPSRKRRPEDEEHHREHKRSRRDREEPREESREETENDYRIERRSSKREEKSSRPKQDQPSRTSAALVEPEQEETKLPPKGPKIDQHAIEREARNAERVARENQRRALMGGGSGGSGKGGIERVNPKGGVGKVIGKGGGGTVNVKGGSGRRTSYKYEDEVMTSKVETEREASRYR
ncbi:hypothetical protein P7C71_g4597, partial [Lecanoromycetidae sp. Uapishka_2]